MFQLDDNFLNDLGLGNLPEEQKKAFLLHIYEQLQLSVGTKLSEGMSEPQMEEFESFIDQDEEKVRAWFAATVPDYATRPDYVQMQQSAPVGATEIALMSEYGSLKWLELNRPDYKQVVAEELETIKQEIIANRDSILEATA